MLSLLSEPPTLPLPSLSLPSSLLSPASVPVPVAPAEDAVTCVECHSPDGRLADLDGFYMPGRDRNHLLDMIGLALIGATLLGACLHGGLRLVFGRKG